jgi:hypothetical protein
VCGLQMQRAISGGCQQEQGVNCQAAHGRLASPDPIFRVQLLKVLLP